MSAGIESFLEAASTNPEIQSDCEAIHSARELVEAGSKHGFAFTVQDVRDAARTGAGESELSEADLENVSGGWSSLLLRIRTWSFDEADALFGKRTR